MSDTSPDRGRGFTGWSIAATLGLLAAAFLVDRLAPTENAEDPARKTKRDAPSGGPTGEGRGRLAESPSEIPAKGWRDILSRVTPTSEIIEFSASPPA